MIRCRSKPNADKRMGSPGIREHHDSTETKHTNHGVNTHAFARMTRARPRFFVFCLHRFTHIA